MASYLRRFKVQIAANSVGNIDWGGNYLQVLQGPAGVSLRSMEGNLQLDDLTDLPAVSGPRFTQLTLSNTTAAAVTVILFVGTDVDARVPKVTGATGVSTALIPGSETISTASGGNFVGSIVAASGQIAVSVRALDSNTARIWLSAAIGSGCWLDAGEEKVITTTADIPLICAVTGQKVQFMQETQ